MGAAVVVAIIVGIFFAVGLIVGGIAVIALPVLRDRRAARRAQHRPGEAGPPEYDHAPPDAGDSGPGFPGPDFPGRDA
jgi:hypothetical protein